MKKIMMSILLVTAIFLTTGCKTKKEQEVVSKPKEEVVKESTTISSSKEKEEEQPKKILLTDGQKYGINKEFFEWAIGRAEIGGMAVADNYFTHGAAGQGDWFAHSVDGDIQLQDQGLPGKEHFSIHGIGGCVFYTSKDGTIGRDAQSINAPTAASYYINMDKTKPHSVYILGDNGVVYEKKAANTNDAANLYAYGEYGDDGVRLEDPTAIFSISEDQAAQNKLTELIKKYENQNIEVPEINYADSIYIPLELMGTWVNQEGVPQLKIDDAYLTVLPVNKVYKISEVEQDDGIYTIFWDIDDFMERYGKDAIGPGPQPFFYELERNQSNRVLKYGSNSLFSNSQM